MVCKHLVQAVHQVPTIFFRQVSRERKTPIWRHPSLRPIHPPSANDLQELPKATVTMPSAGLNVNVDDDGDGEANRAETGEGRIEEDSEADVASDEEDEEEEVQMHIREMKDRLKRLAAELHDLADIIEYNTQFADQRTAALFERRFDTTLKMYKHIREKERRLNSNALPNLPTWSRKFSDIMFVRTRPRERIVQVRNNLGL